MTAHQSVMSIICMTAARRVRTGEALSKACPHLIMKLLLQALAATRDWQGVTSVPMNELYGRILEGRMDQHIPVSLSDGPDTMIPLSRLATLPAGQHLQIQVLLD